MNGVSVQHVITSHAAHRRSVGAHVKVLAFIVSLDALAAWSTSGDLVTWLVVIVMLVVIAS